MPKHSEEDFIAFMNSNRGLKGDEPIDWSFARNGWRMDNGSKPFTKADMGQPARMEPV